MPLLPMVLALTLSAAPKPSPLPFTPQVKRYPNGLTAIFVPFDSPGIAAFYSLVRTGSRNEVEPGRTGFAHFFEHMMFRGTLAHPQEERDQLLSAAGITSNAFTTDDFTAFHTYGPASRLPLEIELEADRFRNLHYSIEDFKTESRAVLGEYNKNFSNPMQKLDEVYADTAYTTHTYRHTTMGYRADIERMPELYDYSRQFFERWYTPDNTTLIFVGDFDRSVVEAAITKHYSGWTRKVAHVAVPVEPPQTSARTATVAWESPTPPLAMIGWHTPSTPSDVAIQTLLASYLLGPTSPIYRDLVLDRQLLFGVGSGYYPHRDPGNFTVIAALKETAALDPLTRALREELEQLKAGTIDLQRLSAIKSNQKYGLLGGLDTANAVAEQLVFAIGPTGDPDALARQLRQLDAVTPAQLAAFARRYFTDTNRTTVTLTGPSTPGAP